MITKSQIIDRAINDKFSLVAEIGVNYYDIAEKLGLSLMEAAKLMITKAKESGIHAVKFQTYKADDLAVKNSPSYWDNTEESETNQYDLFKKYDKFGFNEYKILSNFSSKLGIEFLSTAFDFDSADYLDTLMDVYKISSSDLNNIPFIEYQAKKNKPILISTGASTFDEVKEAVKTIERHNDQPLTIMHCVLEYPTPYEHANLLRIKRLKEEFSNHIIGYSDHTKPDKNANVIKTAYNLGALIVEKHFTLDKTLKGNDHYHAMDYDDAVNILDEINKTSILRGELDVEYLDSELTARENARRSIVAKKKIKVGKVIELTDLNFKRPGKGISPNKIDLVVGKRAKIEISIDSIIEENMISDD